MKSGFAKLCQQEAFEKFWAHSPLRAAVTLPFTRCRYCRVCVWMNAKAKSHSESGRRTVERARRRRYSNAQAELNRPRREMSQPISERLPEYHSLSGSGEVCFDYGVRCPRVLCDKLRFLPEACRPDLAVWCANVQVAHTGRPKLPKLFTTPVKRLLRGQSFPRTSKFVAVDFYAQL